MSSTSPSRRRDFLKQSFLATPVLAGGLSIARSAHAAGSDTIRLALIGCGGRGTGAAVQALNASGRARLVAMADAFEDRLDQSHQSILKRGRSSSGTRR